MDQYYIIKILGRGSEGQVLLAEHKKTHEEVAIKRMEFYSFEEANNHLNEAHRLRMLNHKNIMKYHRVFLHKYNAETHFVCLCGNEYNILLTL
jgi:NIMA (never in mitosis gene a)-related kinase